MLLVRLWVEADHSQGLRARITHTWDPSGKDASVTVVSSVDEICSVMERWVEGFEHPLGSEGKGK